MGGLNPATSENDLREYFSQFGQIVDCVIKPDKTSKGGRNFGFVTYHDAHTAHFVATLVHVIGEKRVDCKPAKLNKTPVDSYASDP